AIGHGQCFQPRQAAGRLVLLALVLGLRRLQELLHEILLFGLVEAKLDDPGLVTDRNDGFIFLGSDHVVDINAATEYLFGVAVIVADGGAGHAQVNGIGQRVAHVLGQSVLGGAALGVQRGLEAVLGAVRLVGD